MSWKITNHSLLEKHFLEVNSSGVRFYQGSLLGTRQFRFGQIECVLLSSDRTLSFQVGNEVFSIPTKAGDPKHQEVISFLVQEVQRTTE